MFCSILDTLHLLTSVINFKSIPSHHWYVRDVEFFTLLLLKGQYSIHYGINHTLHWQLTLAYILQHEKGLMLITNTMTKFLIIHNAWPIWTHGGITISNSSRGLKQNHISIENNYRYFMHHLIELSLSQFFVHNVTFSRHYDKFSHHSWCLLSKILWDYYKQKLVWTQTKHNKNRKT